MEKIIAQFDHDTVIEKKMPMFSFLFCQLAKEAIEVEEKEEKLVSETVKHLSEANVQISYLNEEFTHKSDESRKQKEEITHLLAQVK